MGVGSAPWMFGMRRKVDIMRVNLAQNYRALNDLMEIDHVIRVHENGDVTEPQNVYAPGVYVDALGEPVVSSPSGHVWTLVDGFSGQYCYSGPIMHSSEYVGGALARHILDTPGLYAVVVAYGLDDGLSEDPDDDEPHGWAVAYWGADEIDN